LQFRVWLNFIARVFLDSPLMVYRAGDILKRSCAALQL